jgi:hypothetical protein
MECCSKAFNRTILATLLWLALFYGSKALSADSPSDFTAGDTASVVKLENKLFNHAYDKDTAEHRLERLEKSVFGEALPNLDTPASKTETASSSSSQPSKHHKKSAEERAQNPASAESPTASGDAMDMPGNYPAVSAIEKKILGKAYEADPVGQRLARLETQVFGKASGSSDMSDRVDRLKQKTGIDVTKPPPGSDWSEDDDMFGIPPQRTANRSDSYSQRDLGSSDDLSMGGSYGGSSLGDLARSGSIPSYQSSRSGLGTHTADPYASVLGLNQEVTALELEIFGKSYARDPLPARLNRLETTVFPHQPPSTSQPLPDRVQHLLAVIPLSGQQISQKTRTRSTIDPDYPDTVSSTSTQQPSQQKSPGGLSKIISSLGNLISGGPMGGFSSGNTYYTDPRTGMMVDRISGNIIDPSTGTVIGNNGGSMYSPGYSTGYSTGYPPGLGSFGSFGNFNNGFSPFGSPYVGNPYGYGSGLRFGIGGGGLGRMGGMWP